MASWFIDGPTRSFLTNVVFAIAVFAPFVALVFLSIALWQRDRLGNSPIKMWAGIFVLTLLVNPFSQYFLFERFDNMRGRALAERARAAGIVGMDREQVRALLGEPSQTKDY